MHLVRLQIRGFRLFADPVTIDFPASGVIGIRGFNASTGSGSDSGKSSILEALARVFCYSSFADSDQESWLTESKMQIDAVCLHAGTRYDFHVGARTGIEVDGRSVQKASSSTGYKRWLHEFFQIDDLGILKNLTYRPQRQGGLFLGMSDADKRAFFSEIIGLQRFETLAETIKQNLTVADDTQRNLKATLSQTIEVPVPVAPPAVTTTRLQLEADLDQVEFDDVQALPAVSQTAVVGVEESLRQLSVQEGIVGQAERNKLEAVRAKVKEAVDLDFRDRREAAYDAIALAMQRRDKATAATLAQRSAVIELTNAVRLADCDAAETHRRIDAMRKEMASLNDQETRLEAKLCPTCERTWDDEAYRVRLRAVRDAQQALRDEMAFKIPPRLEEQKATFDAAQAAETAGKQRLAAMEAGLVKVVDAVVAAERNRHAVGQAANDAIADAVQTQAAAIRDEAIGGRQALAARRAAFTDQLAVMKEQQRARDDGIRASAARRQAAVTAWEQEQYAHRLYAQALTARQAYEKAYQDLVDRLAIAEDDLKSWADLQAVVRAFLGAIGEEILAEIAAEANVILAALPNTAEVTLRFVTERLTQKGTMRQEIRAMVSKAGRDGLNVKSQISGGQLTSVELATDPAVSIVLRGRRGTLPTPAWMAFDEAFDGHDVPIKEAFLDVLAGLSSRGMQIFVVDHGTEFKESLTHKINVVCTGGASAVVSDQDFEAAVRAGRLGSQ